MPQSNNCGSKHLAALRVQEVRMRQYFFTTATLISRSRKNPV
jgi:hypothetical protein